MIFTKNIYSSFGGRLTAYKAENSMATIKSYDVFVFETSAQNEWF